MGYLDGFGVIIKKWAGVNSATGARVTVEYPEEVRPKPERFHGRHVLNRYEDGLEKCIGCELCAGVCPAKCIYVRGADNDPENPTSPGERFGYVYEINYLRCIHCDLCVEACPTEAITETKLFEFSFTNRSDAIYTKNELVVGDDGKPQKLPWENWDGGFDPAEDTSGWMRATSPGGDADFKGIIAWAGELGYGVRPPERARVLDEVGAVPAGSPIHEHALDYVEPVEEPEVDDLASTSGVFDAGSLDSMVSEDADAEPDAEGGRRAGEFDAPPGAEGRKRRGSAGVESLDEDLADVDDENIELLDSVDLESEIDDLDGEHAGEPTDRTGYFDAPEGAEAYRGPKPPDPAVEEAPEEPDTPPGADEADDAETGEGSDVDTDDAVTPEEGQEPHLRMGYFDAPDDEPAVKDKDKKKRRFFK